MKIKIVSQKELELLYGKESTLKVLMKKGYTKEDAIAYAKWSASNHPVSIKKRGAK